MNDQIATPVEFNGNSREYFGIWIVNLLLSLITLGVYSAWAKVRRKKYFYHNTAIANVGFDYHANPISILKGRAIAFVFFLFYAFGQHIHVYVPLLFVLLFFTVLPWLVVRASIFNARNSSHRGLRFDFDGSVGESFKVFLLFPLLTLVSLGIAAPYVARLRNKYIVDHHKFGITRFDLQATTSEFYSIYFKFFGIFLLLSLILGGLLFNMTKNILPTAIPATPGLVGFNANSGQKNPSPEELQNRIDKLQQELQKTQAIGEAETSLEPYEDSSDASADSATSVPDPNKIDPKLLKMLENPGTIFSAILLYLIVIFAIISYFQARIGNLIWNTATLDKLSFNSSLRVRDFIWLYLSNFLAILLTFGLATPWAQVRMAKYRASKLALVGEADFDKFVGDKKAEAKSTGEEIADMFDIDISFG
jgi:uncharacterized membrane protein YjgN (DUF898 family)